VTDEHRPSNEPYNRIGKEPDAQLRGIRSARLMRERRILYVIDESTRSTVPS
jgi:hypothetical protein